MTKVTEKQPSGIHLLFGETIYAYSRADALADGSIVDISELAREAGFKFPVAVTSGVLSVLTPPDSNKMESFKGRAWDMLWMLRLHSRRGGGGATIPFTVKLGGCLTRLLAVCGPGGTPAPVITILLPDES